MCFWKGCYTSGIVLRAKDIGINKIQQVLWCRQGSSYWWPKTLRLIRYSNSCGVGRSVGIAPFTDMWDWGWKRSWDFPTVKQERPDSSPVLLSPSPVLQLHCKIPRRIRWRRWILLNSSTFCQILLWKDLQFRTCLKLDCKTFSHQTTKPPHHYLLRNWRMTLKN